MSVVKYIADIFYDLGGHTAAVYDVKFIESRTGYIWDDVAGALALSPAVGDYSIPLVEVGTTGVFPIHVPAALPAGNYDYVVTKRGGSPAAQADDVVLLGEFVQGDIMGF
jgi:hypothetical protein